MQLFVQDDSDDELQLELSQQEEQKQKQFNDSRRLIDETQQKNDEQVSVVSETTVYSPNDEDAILYPLIPDDLDESTEFKPNIEDIRPVDIQLNLSLPFQQQIIEDVLATDDPLVIMGKGLGMVPIVSNLLHVLATPTVIKGQLKRSLVVVLNATGSENRQISEELEELNWLVNADDNAGPFASIDEDDDDDPKYSIFNEVTAETLSVEKRRQLYLKGGIVSVTSRIFIVDLLSGTIHPNRITGFVVLNADNLRNFSNESFILEIYRSKNRWGFIKAFSNNPESFSMSFSPLINKMKELHLKNVLLWPRFRIEVSASLNNDKVINGQTRSDKVIEVRINPLMQCHRYNLA